MKRLLIVILAILVMAGAVFAQDAEPGAGETAKPAETKTEPVAKKKAKASLKISGEFRTYTGYRVIDSEATGTRKAGVMLYRSEMRLKFKAKYSDWLVGFGYLRARTRFKNDAENQTDEVKIKDEIWTRIGRKTGIFAFIGKADIFAVYAGEMPYCDSGAYEEFNMQGLSIQFGYNFGMGEIAVGIYRPDTEIIDGTEVAASSSIASILITAKIDLGKVLNARIGFFSNVNDTDAYGSYSLKEESKMALIIELNGKVSMLYYGLSFAWGISKNEDQVVDGDETCPMVISFDVGVKTVVTFGVQFNYFVNLERQMRFNIKVAKKFGKLGLALEFYYETYNEDLSGLSVPADSSAMGFVFRTKFKF